MKVTNINSMVINIKKKCKAITKEGVRCKRAPVLEGYCNNHYWRRKKREMIEEKKKGDKKNSTPVGNTENSKRHLQS